MIQGEHTVLENYKANMKYIQKIRPQELQYIIIGHVHQDHIGMIPTLYARGKCNAKIIVPKGSTSILKEMWLDSSFINCRDVEVINLKMIEIMNHSIQKMSYIKHLSILKKLILIK